MPNPSDLISPSGQPLIPERKVIVIKSPRGIHIHPQLIEGLSKATGCSVINLPMDCEFMMGDLAVKELKSLHHGIHHILEVPDVVLSDTELKVMYAMARFLCERTQPEDGSQEVVLLHKLGKIIG